MVKLNENEVRALKAICADCDELDGWGFTRPSDVMLALMNEFDMNPQVAGGYLSDLIEKELIELEPYDNEVWVRQEVFEAYC